MNDLPLGGAIGIDRLRAHQLKMRSQRAKRQPDFARWTSASLSLSAATDVDLRDDGSFRMNQDYSTTWVA